MASWAAFRSDRPELAEAGRGLLYQFGVGLAFLATVRRDGGPRTHPVCPLVTADRLFVFVIPSPKRDDLERDGRYALHSFPCPENEDAFYAAGRAQRVMETPVFAAMAEQFIEERPNLALHQDDMVDQRLYELDLETCMVTRTTGHGDLSPNHVTWNSPQERAGLESE